MAHQYTRFLEILKKWPVDEARTIHCFGQYLRNSSSLWFTKEGKIVGSFDECEKRLASLERLSTNYYGQKYPVPNVKTATGMNVDECRDTLVSDYTESKGIIRNLLSKIFRVKSIKA